MKTLVKLLVVALVLNATWRIGSAYWSHYQFQDAVKEAAQFDEHGTAEDLTAKILDLADKMDIPIQPDDLHVVKEQRRITVDADYFRDIEVAPRVSRHWEFSIHVTVLSVS